MPRGTDYYDEARWQRRLWTPAQWRGTDRLFGWFDASVMSNKTYTVLGEDTWLDLSGRDGHARWGASQANSWSPIGWVSPTRNLPTVVSNASTLASFAPSPSIAYAGATGYSAHVAFINTAGGGSLFSGPSAGAPHLSIDTSSVLSLVRANQLLLFSAANTVPVGPNIVGMDASSNYCALWINGVRETNSTDPAFTQPFGVLFNTFNGFQPFLDSASEFVFCGQKLSDPENYTLQGYLAWKWGTDYRLPASHPFKNRPPLIGD